MQRCFVAGLLKRDEPVAPLGRPASCTVKALREQTISARPSTAALQLLTRRPPPRSGGKRRWVPHLADDIGSRWTAPMHEAGARQARACS